MAQMEQMIQWLKEKWGEDRPCPMCGSPDWVVDAVGGVPQLSRKTGLNLESGFPIVPVSCTNCGFTAFMNALIAGIVQSDEQ